VYQRLGFGQPVPATLDGAIVYLDNNKGSDATGTGSEFAPFASIEAAVAAAPPGARILARPGLPYRLTAQLLIDKSLTIQNVYGAGNTYTDDDMDAPAHMVEIRASSQVTVSNATWVIKTNGTAHAGTGNTVFERAMTVAPVGVFFPDVVDQFGFWQTMRKAVSIADCNVNPWSYYHDGTKIYYSFSDQVNIGNVAAWIIDTPYSVRLCVMHLGRYYVAIGDSTGVAPGVDVGWEDSWTRYETPPVASHGAPHEQAYPRYIGTYAAGTNYALGNIVSYTISSKMRHYVARTANGPGSAVVTPGANAAVWLELLGEQPNVNEAAYLALGCRDFTAIGVRFCGAAGAGLKAWQYGYGAGTTGTAGYYEGPWTLGGNYTYTRKSTVSHNKRWYRALGSENVAPASTEPGVGASWATMWVEISGASLNTAHPADFGTIRLIGCDFCYNRNDGVFGETPATASAMGFSTYGKFRTEAVGCRAFRNTTDGFNYHMGGEHYVTDCMAMYNGDNGISPHESAYLRIEGGWYYGNAGSNSNAQIAYAGGAKGSIIGAAIGDANVPAGTAMGISAISLNGSIDLHRQYLTVRDCLLYNCDVGVSAKYGSRINATSGNTYTSCTAERAVDTESVMYPAPA
jgi:hypothetical protein